MAAPCPRAAPSAVAAAGNPGEVVELRDERSRTLRTPEGKFKTEFSDVALNYRDAHGAWQPIDNTLVASSDPGYALRNAGGRLSVSLPAALDKAPVRVSGDGHWVAFALRGASGAPTVDKTDKAKAAYPALPGVSVSYNPTNQGLQEDLVLAGPQAPAAYDFTVELSPGLAARETPDGGIAFVDHKGAVWASFQPPTISDASASPPAQNLGSPSVSLKILPPEAPATPEPATTAPTNRPPATSTTGVTATTTTTVTSRTRPSTTTPPTTVPAATSPRLVVRLAADPAWLADPARVWPVTIDPTIQENFNQIDLLYSAAPNTNYSTNPQMGVLGGTSVLRTFYRSWLYFPNFFTGPVDITYADVELWADTTTTGQAAQPVGVARQHDGTGSAPVAWDRVGVRSASAT